MDVGPLYIGIPMTTGNSIIFTEYTEAINYAT